MLQRLSHNLLILTFLLAISTPLAVMLIADRDNISEYEKRRLANPPEWHWDSRLLNEFPEQFTRFFDDHYGLRNALVQRSQDLKKKFLGKSPTWSVIRGEQGWLFLNKRGSLRDHIGHGRLDKPALDQWQQHLLDKRDWLQSLGIAYFFVPIPNKMTLFSHFLPARIREHSGETRLDQLLAHLEKEGRFQGYANLEPALASYRDSHPDIPLYFKTDTHWTSHGAFIAYRQIMQSLTRVLPQLEPPLTLEQMRYQHRAKDGDLANIIDMNAQIDEATYNLVPREPCAAETYLELSAFAQTPAYQANQKKLPEFNGCREKAFTAVVVHDSFGAYLKPFLSESFKRVIYMRSYDLGGMESFLRQERPDLYLDLRIERNLHRLLRPDEKLRAALGR